MDDDDFSDDYDSKDEDDLALEDEWDTPSESEDRVKKNKKQQKSTKKTEQKREQSAPSGGRVTRSSGVVQGTNGRRSKKIEELENEEVNILLKPQIPKGVKRP